MAHPFVILTTAAGRLAGTATVKVLSWLAKNRGRKRAIAPLSVAGWELLVKPGIDYLLHLLRLKRDLLIVGERDGTHEFGVMLAYINVSAATWVTIDAAAQREIIRTYVEDRVAATPDSSIGYALARL